MKIKVYDSAGRIVRTIANGILNEGKNEFTWNRIDDTGKVVSSGTYIVIIETENKRLTKTITIMK